MSTVGVIQAAQRASLDMREVSERLDKAAFNQERLKEWRDWVYDLIRQKETDGVLAQ